MKKYNPHNTLRISALSILFIIVSILIVSAVVKKKQWLRAIEENTLLVYEDYVERYPNSRFAKEAKSLIVDIKWDLAQDSNTIEALQQFIDEHPKHKLAKKAHTHIIEIRWNNADQLNTIAGYSDFLKHHPEGSFAQKATRRLLKFREARPPFQKARKAFLIIRQDYEANDKDSTLKTLKKNTTALLNYIGIDLADNSEEGDFTITIRTTGYALSDTYYNMGARWTGAKVRGSVVFQASSGYRMTEIYSSSVKPPKKVKKSQLSEDRADAPFDEAIVTPVSEKIALLIYKCFGMSSLHAALYDSDADIRQSASVAIALSRSPKAIPILSEALKADNYKIRALAAESLGITNSPHAIEPLVLAMKETYVDIRRASYKSLKKITGKNPGTDHKDWETWWTKNKAYYIK